MTKKLKRIMVAMTCVAALSSWQVMAQDFTTDSNAPVKAVSNAVANQDEQAEVATQNEAVLAQEPKAEEDKAQEEVVQESEENESKSVEDETTDDEWVQLLEEHIEPMQAADGTIGNISIDSKVSAKDAKALADSTVTREGDFVTYTSGKNAFTVYESRSSSDLDKINDSYKIADGTVVQIHIADEDVETARGIKVGMERGKIILEYGAPQAIWRAQNSNKSIFWYQVPLENDKMGLIAFTSVDREIESIDLFAGDLNLTRVWPNLQLNQNLRGTLADSDFRLLGYRLNDEYIPENGVNHDWNDRGKLWHQNYTASNDGVIVYDDEYRISKIFLTLGMGTTSRGVSVGTNKLLMFAAYGKPMRKIEDFDCKLEKGQVAYEYQNPNAVGEYLTFVVSGEDDFIDSIILSNRPIDKIYVFGDRAEAKKLIYGKISSVRKN